MNWDIIVDKLNSHIVKIETQDGHGTGFLALYNEDKTLCGVATAMHVVARADEWQQPIRLKHHLSGKTVFIEAKKDERAIWLDPETDSAVILFPKKEFPLPEDSISLLPRESSINIGIEVGWLGFPSVAPDDLCFFSGNISAQQEIRKAYLIDGVAINGVSGGPVFHATEADGIRIVGIVTEYWANQARIGTLPGLLLAQDVSHFHGAASRLKTIEEAIKKEVEFEGSQRERASLQPAPL